MVACRIALVAGQGTGPFGRRARRPPLFCRHACHACRRARRDARYASGATCRVGMRAWRTCFAASRGARTGSGCRSGEARDGADGTLGAVVASRARLRLARPCWALVAPPAAALMRLTLFSECAGTRTSFRSPNLRPAFLWARGGTMGTSESYLPKGSTAYCSHAACADGGRAERRVDGTCAPSAAGTA